MNMDVVREGAIHFCVFMAGFAAALGACGYVTRRRGRLEKRQEETIEELRERLSNLSPAERDMEALAKSREFWRTVALQFWRAFRQTNAVLRNTKHACGNLLENIRWDADNDVPEMIESDDRARDMYYAENRGRGYTE